MGEVSRCGDSPASPKISLEVATKTRIPVPSAAASSVAVAPAISASVLAGSAQDAGTNVGAARWNSSSGATSARRLPQPGVIGEVTADERHVAGDRREVRRVGARIADHAHDLAAGGDQQLGEVGAVLAGDPGDERARSQRPGGHAGDPGPVGHVVRDDGPGRHDGVGADPARPEHERARPDPGAGPDLHVAAIRRDARWRASRGLGDVVRPGQHGDAVTEERVLADRDRARDGVEQGVVDVRRSARSPGGRAAPTRDARAASAPRRRGDRRLAQRGQPLVQRAPRPRRRRAPACARRRRARRSRARAARPRRGAA